MEDLSCTLMRILLLRQQIVSNGAVPADSLDPEAHPQNGNQDSEDELLCVILALCLNLARADSDFAAALLCSGEQWLSCRGRDRVLIGRNQRNVHRLGRLRMAVPLCVSETIGQTFVRIVRDLLLVTEG